MPEHVTDQEVAVLRSDGPVGLNSLEEFRPFSIGRHTDSSAAFEITGPVAFAMVGEVHVRKIEFTFKPGRPLCKSEPFSYLSRTGFRGDHFVIKGILFFVKANVVRTDRPENIQGIGTIFA